ncbi:MAG TPA: hypothetical protein VFF48_06485 [Brevundimonas sp.]|nr:hypothetical protein [Brevundimonas sp.]
MRSAVLFFLMSLAACGPSEDSVDVADVNARNALAEVSSLRGRVDELESQVQGLQNEVQNEAMLRESEDAQIADEVANHSHY